MLVHMHIESEKDNLVKKAVDKSGYLVLWSEFHRKPVNIFVDHTHTQFTEESKMATALTPQTDVTSGKVT